MGKVFKGFRERLTEIPDVRVVKLPFFPFLKSIFYKKIHMYLGGGKNLHELPYVSALFQ